LSGGCERGKLESKSSLLAKDATNGAPSENGRSVRGYWQHTLATLAEAQALRSAKKWQ
jgi:hypothetical protein